MITTLVRFLKLILRGYGQLFVANGVVPGALIVLGLAVLAPIDALRSLLCVGIVTAWAMRFSSDELVETGLYGVNGVLLGLLWMLFPEVAESTKLIGSVGGALAMSVLICPAARFIQRQRWPFALFSAPYVATAWLTIIALYGTGTYDRHQFQGWAELFAAHPENALRHFAEAKTTTPKAEAFRENGMGWGAYHLGQYSDAATHFKHATELLPEHADSFVGLGWSQFKQSQFPRAKAQFETALAQDAKQADAWDGLGWTHFVTGETAEAQRCFSMALSTAPLLADSYDGLTQCAIREQDDVARDRYAERSASIRRYIALPVQRVSMRQALCWLLFIIAIGIHSRTSLCVAVIGIIALIAGAHTIPALNQATRDTGFVYTMLTLYLALGGQYMRLNAQSIVWMILTTILLAFGWNAVIPALLAQGLPPLSLLFNASLIGSLVFCRIPARFIKRFDASVPLEVAVTSPEAVRRWAKKCNIAEKVWHRLDPER